jgi:hypothetical protein
VYELEFIALWVRPILELLYFLASIGLFASVFIGLRQLKLVKEDIKVRNKRASVEKSIEYLNMFATDFIPKITDKIKEINESKLAVYKGPFNPKFVFDHNCDLKSQVIKDYYLLCYEIDVVYILNELEFFSAALVSGLADEELAFNPLADFYCSTVERFYVTICANRENGDSRMYSNIINLYGTWKDRLHKMELESKRREIDENISKIEDRRIPSIGM